MTQKDLIKAVATDVNSSEKYKDNKVTVGVVEDVIKSFTDVTKNALIKGDKIQIAGFGIFETAERAAREGRNPSTGEAMHIAASKCPKFKAAKAFKEALNQ